uniref:Uncharacterized protein n=1 Tax=Tetradesmus obliquus TaxID=3088 RepID=A0A383VGH5_TETOB
MVLLLLTSSLEYILCFEPLPSVCPDVEQPRCESSASAGSVSAASTAAAAAAAAGGTGPTPYEEQQQSATPSEQQAAIIQHLRALEDAEAAQLDAASSANLASETQDQAVLNLSQAPASSFFSSSSSAGSADAAAGAPQELPVIFTAQVPADTPAADPTGSSSSSSSSEISSSSSSSSSSRSSGSSSDVSHASQPPRGAVPRSLVQRNLTFLQSQKLKIGLDVKRLGAVSWLSSSLIPEPWTDRNLINVYDQGRLLQQSFYGCEDGSCWASRSWRFNPVQGGSWDHKPSLTTRREVHHAQGSVYVEGHPRNWGKGTLLRSVHFTQHAHVHDDVAVLNFSVHYTGNFTHPYLTHEVPAVFIDRRFGVLAYYAGDRPWTNDRNLSYTFPPASNIYMPTTEGWAAYLNPVTGWGVGVMAPHAWAGLTAYRVGPDWSTAPSDCSYFAHTIRMQLHPAMRRYSYKVYVTVGRIGAMRRLFEKIGRFQPYKRPAADPVAAQNDAEELRDAEVVAEQQQQQQQQKAAGFEAKQELLGRNPGLFATGSSSSGASGVAAAAAAAAGDAS